MLGWTEILLILLIVLIVFGAGKFPKIMQNFAEGINIFKKTMKEEENKTKKSSTSKTTKKKTTPKKK